MFKVFEVQHGTTFSPRNSALKWQILFEPEAFTVSVSYEFRGATLKTLLSQKVRSRLYLISGPMTVIFHCFHFLFEFHLIQSRLDENRTPSKGVLLSVYHFYLNFNGH